MNSYMQNTMFSQINRSQTLGSTVKSFLAKRVRDEGTFSFISIQNIAAMDEYKNKSVKEIRKEDYEIGNKKSITVVIPYHLSNKPPLNDPRVMAVQTTPYGTQQSFTNPIGSFGNIQQKNPSFGATNINPFASQTPNAFTQQTTNSINQNPFGMAQQSYPFNPSQPTQTPFSAQNTNSLFGQTLNTAPNPFDLTTNTQNLSNDPTSGVFGSNQQQSTTTGFINNPQNTFIHQGNAPSQSTFLKDPFNTTTTANNHPDSMNNFNNLPNAANFIGTPPSQQVGAFTNFQNTTNMPFPPHQNNTTYQNLQILPNNNDNFSLGQNMHNITNTRPMNTNNHYQSQLNHQNNQGLDPYQNFIHDSIHLEKLAKSVIDDPFMLGNLTFPKIPQSEPPVIKQIPRAQNSLFPEETTSKNDIIPNLVELTDEQLYEFYSNKLSRISFYPGPDILYESDTIDNFRIRIHPNIQITFLEPIKAKDILGSDLESTFVAQGTSVHLMSADDPVFSKKARIEVSNVFPSSFEQFYSRNMDILLYRFIRVLKAHKGRTFISYDCNNGIYVYEVDSIPILDSENNENTE